MPHRITELTTHNNDVAIITFEHQGERHKMRCVKNGPHDHCAELDASSNMDEIVMEKMANELMENYHLFTEGETPMKINIDITNKRYSGDEELIIHQYSGYFSDLPDSILNHLDWEHCDELTEGDWITIVDGDVVEIGEFHPFHIHAEPESLEDQIREVRDSFTMNTRELDILKEAADIVERRC